MEGYYNNIFQTSARRGSTIDRITDPGTVTNYLCGYSLRICTLYLIWIHLVFFIFLLAMLIIATTYISINFKVTHEPNNTLYKVFINGQKWVSIDANTEDLDVNLGFIGHYIVLLFFGWVIIEMCVAVLALLGVYLDKLLLLVLYIVPIFINIIFWIFLLIIEGTLAVLKVFSWSWVSALFCVIMLLKDLYRFVVLYSYLHMIGRHCFSTKPRTPLQYLTTHSPNFLQTEMPATLTHEKSPSIKSNDLDSIKNG